MSKDSVNKAVELLKAHKSTGKVSGLTCPQCDRPTVEVWFTEAQPGRFRSWFACSDCRFEARVQLSGRPVHFDKSRVRADLQARDAEIMDNAKFPEPE